MILLEGMLLGFLYAIIPGGSILVGLKLAIAPGYSRAAAFAYGVLLIDSVYAFLAVTAAAAATDVYVRLSAAHPSVLPGMQIALVAALGIYGVYLLLKRSPSVDGVPGGECTGSVGSRKVPPHGYLLLGMSLKASTIVSPSFLAGFALLTSQAQALGLGGWSFIDRAVFATGFGLGNFLYLRICMRLATRYTRRLPGTRFMRLQKGLGAAFAVLGVLLFLHMIQGWKW